MVHNLEMNVPRTALTHVTQGRVDLVAAVHAGTRGLGRSRARTRRGTRLPQDSSTRRFRF